MLEEDVERKNICLILGIKKSNLHADKKMSSPNTLSHDAAFLRCYGAADAIFSVMGQPHVVTHLVGNSRGNSYCIIVMILYVQWINGELSKTDILEFLHSYIN